MSLLEFSKRIIEVLKQNNVPFTLHWGKNGDWAFPGLVDHMYDAAKIQEWKACRCALLSDDMLELFSNKFLKDIGLADNKLPINEDLIES